jgi:negative regulator of flagellin synthesis FlgM
MEIRMKIGSPLDAQAAAGASVRTARTADTPIKAGNSGASTDQVAVSAAGAQMGAVGTGDFDSAKVDAIRQAIREGRFTVNPEAIADRLIADAAALLRPRST